MEIGHWLNGELGNTQIKWFEDPVEDVFVTNVETTDGNRRVFEGIWNSNDYFVQTVIDVLSNREAPKEIRSLLGPTFALLKLSDSVAERAGLQRWHAEPSTPSGEVKLASATKLADQARAVIFIDSQLDELDIDRDLLAPFILRDEDKRTLATETTGNTSLERRPLVDIGEELILALPHAVSPAIRRFVLTELLGMGYLGKFCRAIEAFQAQQVEMYGLRELKKDIGPLNPPAPDGQVPTLHGWLRKYDIDKYLHVVLIHDRLNALEREGFNSFLQYSEEVNAALREHLDKIAHYCASLPDFAEGTTLLVLGGLGRGFALSLKDRPNRWHMSVIGISDILMLTNESDRPVTRYLKFIKQKDQVGSEGVDCITVSGDYSFYCFWRRSDYQLVPQDLPLRPSAKLSILSDSIFPVRKEVRNLVDRHVAQTPDGSYVPVMRFHRDAYFSSLRDRPIYVSISHLVSGKLAGAVETPRGLSWLVLTSREGGEHIHRFPYEMWKGFIDLYDKLVFEVESSCLETVTGALEVRLDCSNILTFEDGIELQSDLTTIEPEVVVTLEQRTAAVKFPPNLLQHFCQPENTGEKLVLRSVAKGLVRLHQGVNNDVEEGVLESLINRVISDPGMRILHAFHIYDPVELLRERKSRGPIFLAQEDFAFSKLKLSEGCTPRQTGTTIVSKTECNEFLHRVVTKVWGQLRERLQQFDRTSVIQEVLQVNEAVLHDRDHWRRTAQAVFALYTQEEDVLAIAREREALRITAGLSARTILEIAVCECPDEGGRQLSRWGLDELLAKATLMLGAASDSDAVNNDLVEPQIDLHPNGEYTMDRSFQETVMKPFLTAYHQEGFEEAAAKYPDLYRSVPSSERRPFDEIFSSDFICAFRAEFGLKLDEALDGFAELMDFAVEHDSLVMETTLGDARNRLTASRGLSVDASEAFVRTFGLYHRPAWETPPVGFAKKDLYPWRFSRRLSAIFRPLLVFGEENKSKVFFGVGALILGIGQLVDKIKQGHLSQDFFTSAAMRQYIGTINHEKGHAFARLVSARLREKGWQTRVEVQMTELGAPAELGDVDVLAWRKLGGEIKIVECKRLQLARTVAEVADICRRFRGEARDELDKHLQRINWIRSNPAGLRHIVGFVPNPAHIDDRLVTNMQVPMTYLTSLPIAPEKIGPLK